MNKKFKTLHLDLVILYLKACFHGPNLTPQGLYSFAELSDRTSNFDVKVLHIVSELIRREHSDEPNKLQATILERNDKHVQVLESFALQICSWQ